MLSNIFKKKIPEPYFGQFLFDFGIIDTTMIGETRSLSSAPNILYLIIIKENQFWGPIKDSQLCRTSYDLQNPK